MTINVPLTKEFQLDADGVLGAITDKTKYIIICTRTIPPR